MSFPPDVLIPNNAKYHGFVDPKLGFNSHWDVTWSFTYALSGTQHGFCTFLSTDSSPLSGNPAQYLGLTTNADTRPITIAFDSTGLFALSSSSRTGVGIDEINANSLIVRDSYNSLLCNVPLSSLDTSFVLSSPSKMYNTLRFRLANAGRILHIDYETINTVFKSLTTLDVNVDPDIVYPGITFCSPISSNSITPSTFYLQNFHVQGNNNLPTYENISYVSLTSYNKTSYTTINPITAIPL